MRRIVPLLAAVVAAMFLVSGVAAAAPLSYEVNGEWALAYVDGRPTVVPRIEDDTVELRCRDDDEMSDWRVNVPDLVDDSGELTDETGVFVQPAFTDENEILQITVVCERS